MTHGQTMPRVWVIEPRLMCTVCGRDKQSFAYDPTGYMLFNRHMKLIHNIILNQADKDAITNA